MWTELWAPRILILHSLVHWPHHVFCNRVGVAGPSVGSSHIGTARHVCSSARCISTTRCLLRPPRSPCVPDQVLDSVPDLDLLSHLPALLEGLLGCLGDGAREIRVAAHKALMVRVALV